jgi:uncharacterized repeat protein (TIGR01451 family)
MFPLFYLPRFFQGFCLWVVLMAPSARAEVSPVNPFPPAEAVSPTALPCAVDDPFLDFPPLAGDPLTAGAGSDDDIVVCDLLTGDIAVVGSGGEAATVSNSRDGRYQAFASAASEGVADDGNGVGDIFVRDLRTGGIRRASVATGGVEADGESTSPALSGAGGFVVFGSLASNLVEGDTNAARDLFIHDLTSGVTALIGLGLGESPFGKSGIWPAYSADGRYLAVRRDGLEKLAAWFRDPPAKARPASPEAAPFAAAPLLAATEAAPEADLGVDLALNVDTGLEPARVGQVLYYDFTVVNYGPSPATDIQMTLNIGAATVAALPPECAQNQNGGPVVCSLGTLPEGSPVSGYHYREGYIVARPTAIGSLEATATVSATETDPDPSDNLKSANRDIQAASADLAVSLIAPPGPSKVGAELTYSFTVSNLGPSGATGVTLVATLGDVTVLDLRPGCTYAPANQQVRCSLGTVSVGNNGEFTQSTPFVVVRPKTEGSLIGTATVETATPDPATDNNLSEITRTVEAASANLKVGLTTPASDPIRVGDSLEYRVSLENQGPSVADNVTLTVTFADDAGPVNVASAPGGCTVTGNQARCSFEKIGKRDGYPTGGYENYGHNGSFSVRPTQPGSLVASASVAAATAADPDPDDNSVSLTRTIEPRSANLALTLTATPAPPGTVRVGEPIRYDFSFTNAGPSQATHVVLNLIFGTPGAVSPITPPTGCTLAESPNQVRCSYDPINPGGVVSGYFTVVPTVDGSLATTATVSGEGDNNAADSTATIATTVNPPSVDIKTEMTASSARVKVGEALTYSVKVTNHGPSDATGVIFTSDLGAVEVVSKPPECSVESGQLRCLLPNIGKKVGAQAGGPVSWTFTVRPKAAGLLTNTARVAANEADAAEADNIVPVDTPVDPLNANLKITLAASPAAVKVGEVVTYTFTVTNAGPDAASNAVFTIDLGAVGDVGVPNGCTLTGRRLQCPLGTLASGGQSNGHFGARTVAAGPLAATATVTAAEIDPDPADNTATVTAQVNPPNANLKVTLTASPAAVKVGEVVTYNFTVTNAGPDAAPNAVFAIDLGTVGDVGVPNGCTLTGRRLQCLFGTLASGGQSNGHFGARTVAAGSLAATATVTAAEIDPDPADNTATVTTDVATSPVTPEPPASADLTLTLATTPDAVQVGQPLTYNLIVSNAGPAIATGVSATAELGTAAGLILPEGCTADGSRVRCSWPRIVSGGQVQRNFTVRPGVAGALAGNAAVTAAETDPDTADNQAGVITAVNPLPPGNLAITQKAGAKQVKVGKRLKFTVTVQNKGRNPAAGVVVTDVLPAGVRFAASNSGCTYAEPTRTVTCALGALSGGQKKKLVLHVAAERRGRYTHTVAVAGEIDDSDPRDNARSAKFKVP